MSSEEFLDVVGKLPRFDASGRDLLEDILSTGGFRRDDGTLSAMAFDLRIVKQGEDVAREIGDTLPDLSSDVPRLRIAAAAILTAGVVGVVVFRKPLTTWFQEKTLPTLAKWWPNNRPLSRFLPKDVQVDRAPFAHTTAVEHAPEDPSSAIEKAVEDSRQPMGRAEAELRLARMLAAAAILVKEYRVLSNARLDDDGYPALKKAMEALTEQEVTDLVNRALASSAEVDEETTETLMANFGGGQVLVLYLPKPDEADADDIETPHEPGDEKS
ncbi:hypothetical protein [Microbacterium sp. MYb45]|uniref:hypothetical protein n=1 Tax=Microbacterium sp. MYb45 TaxID=1827294 RepID=UPI000CFED7B5|nr:hypothetical protein [Microbacterium sp. MYb45]PRB65659.1 hypothetical protein CQ034_06115 [Microbacterium sp. MYb45]